MRMRRALSRANSASMQEELPVFFLMADRTRLIQQVPKNAVWAEIGVYKGDFSQQVLDACEPAEYYLIDNWKFEIADHNALAGETENFSNFAGKIHWDHFGDDPNGIQEQNFQYVTSRFAERPNVKIIRDDSANGIQALADASIDVMYIDANHQYEYVLRDMIHAQKKIKPGGIILMNDFYEGPGGAEQNLGVMGAVNTFVKRYDFHYLAMTHGSFADVALTDDPGSPFVRAFLENLKDSDLFFIGVSDVLVPNLRYKMYRKANGELRYVALL
jgi:Methyltransferase domain